MLKKILTSPWTALLTLALIVSIRIADPVFVESVRLRYFDTLITDRAATVSEQIHVVNIDDRAIAQRGQSGHCDLPRDFQSPLSTRSPGHGN